MYGGGRGVCGAGGPYGCIYIHIYIWGWEALRTPGMGGCLWGWGGSDGCLWGWGPLGGGDGHGVGVSICGVFRGVCL